ncbi:MAG: efflux transporter outer membrane subunit [Clostridium sp.]|nr:efflux transporter outer membrane subunit [Clostridium sp.]
MRLHTVLSSALLCAGACAFGQTALTESEMPQQWRYATEYYQTIPTDDKWWNGFEDSLLDSLISVGVDNNYNVLMAQRRIEMARQAVRQAQSGYYPQLSLDGGWTRARTSGMTGSTPASANTASYFDLGVSMNWELDVFGKVTSRAKESKAQFQATRAEYAATMVSVSAKIASTYFQLRTVQGELEVMERHIESQKRVLDITQARFDAGLSSKLDVTQASTTYYSTLASITSLRTQESTYINALAVLLGVFPKDIADTLLVYKPLPDYHRIVSIGLPMELLRRRPDIVEAECTLAADAAALGVAKKDFLPTLSLQGSVGTQAHKIGDMFTDQSFTYSIAPTLSWTIFDGFSRKAAVASAKEQMLASIDNYNLTVITAVQEAGTAMEAYTNDLRYIDYLTKVVDAARESLTLSVDLYKQGLSPFINVSDAQITLLQYSNQLVSARGQALVDLVTLYQAVGGGWEGF